MGKKFQFKLEGLLKLRKFNEQKIKVELGEIVKEISAVENKIRELKSHIEETYESQDQVMKDSVNGQLARFFPYYIQAKREDIKNQENLLFSLKKRYEAKVKEMGKAMGEVKVIENFKDKELTEFKSEQNKKLEAELEENMLIRRASLKNR